MCYFGCMSCLFSSGTLITASSCPCISSACFLFFILLVPPCSALHNFLLTYRSSALILSSSLSNLFLNPSVKFLISVHALFSVLDFFFFFRYRFSVKNFHLVSDFFVLISYRCLINIWASCECILLSVSPLVFSL